MKKIIFFVVAILLVFSVFQIFKSKTEVIEKVVFYNNNEQTVEIFVKIADNDSEMEKGLKFQEELLENEGMLFIFPDEDLRSFWMKDTLISLDMIFLDSNQNIVSIKENAEPCNVNPCSLYNSKEKSQYIIEVNAGFCAKYNINKETQVEF